jgi:hypothetical protein
MSKADIAKALLSNVEALLARTSPDSFRSSPQHISLPTTKSSSSHRRSYSTEQLEQLIAEDFAHMQLADDVNKLKDQSSTFRYWGSSAGIQLIKTTHNLRWGQDGSPDSLPVHFKRQVSWSSQPVSLTFRFPDSCDGSPPRGIVGDGGPICQTGRAVRFPGG